MRKFCAVLAIVLVVFNSCVKYEGDEFLPKEIYGQTDTLSSLYVGIFRGWDFKNLHPEITQVSFQKTKWDSVVDPDQQPYVQWVGNFSNGWYYDNSPYSGRFKIRFLTDNLIDTSVPPYDDYGTYMDFYLNEKLINKPVAEVIDTVGNRNVLTLILDKRNNFKVKMDTAELSMWPLNRPPAKEMAKTFNKLFYSLDQNYLFQKRKP